MSKDLNKERALAAMLGCNTLTEAAEKAQISRKTLYNYIRNDGDFGAAYRAARDQITLEQMDALNNGKERATALLLGLMDDTKQPASLRMKAAQTILTTATKPQEIASEVRTGTYQQIWGED